MLVICIACGMHVYQYTNIASGGIVQLIVHMGIGYFTTRNDRVKIDVSSHCYLPDEDFSSKRRL